MIKISIVMPVYNTGIYLTETQKSLFVQKFKEFELIYVDDASNDALTKNILQNYEKNIKICK
jgi:Glycosyltransferases involved in cell wall biogenesis